MSQSTMANNTHARSLAQRIVEGAANPNIATPNNSLPSNLKHSFSLKDLMSKGVLIPAVVATFGLFMLVALSVYFFRSWSRVRRRRRMSISNNESLAMPVSGKVGTVAALRMQPEEGRSRSESGEESDMETAYTAYTDKTSTIDLERDRGSLDSSLISPRSSASSSGSSSYGLARPDDSQTRQAHYIPHHIWQASLQAQSQARSSTSSSSKSSAWTLHARTNSDEETNPNSIVNTQTMAGSSISSKLNHQQQVAATRKPCHCKGCRDARKPSLSIGLGATHVRSSLLPIEEGGADKEGSSPSTLSYDGSLTITSHGDMQRKGSLLGRALSLGTRGKLSDAGVVRSQSQCRRLAPTSKDISRPPRVTKEQEKEEDDWLTSFGDGIPISNHAQTEKEDKENVGTAPSTSPRAPSVKGLTTTSTTFDNATRSSRKAPLSSSLSSKKPVESPVFIPHSINAPRRPLSAIEPARTPTASFIASSLLSQAPSISEYRRSNTTYSTSPTISDKSCRVPSTSVTSSPSSVYSCNSATPTSVRSMGSNKHPRPLTRRKPSPRWEDILKEEEMKASAATRADSRGAVKIVPDAPKLAGLEDVQSSSRYYAPPCQAGTVGVEVLKRREWDCRDSAEPSTYAALKWMAEEDWVENDRPVSYGYAVEKEGGVRAGKDEATVAPFGLGRGQSGGRLMVGERM